MKKNIWKTGYGIVFAMGLCGSSIAGEADISIQKSLEDFRALGNISTERMSSNELASTEGGRSVVDNPIWTGSGWIFGRNIDIYGNVDGMGNRWIHREFVVPAP